MDDWDEIKTAYQVARMGTVSGAAEVLGVHHATVIRHIDALEGRLGVKLFQRHPRGYTATEAGKDLLRVATATDDQFTQMVGRIKGRGSEVSGDLVVTSLAALSPRITPLLADFQKQHKDVVVRYLTGSRLFRLEYGEAHVAIRAGVAPDQPDNVVQPMLDLEMAAYASKGYVAEYGIPKGPDEYAARVSDVRGGAGIGFIETSMAARDPDLVQIHAPRPEWSAPIWLVTHVDLHRTTKVQALLSFLKEHVRAAPQ